MLQNYSIVELDPRFINETTEITEMTNTKHLNTSES